MREQKYTNELIHESSPYLLGHAHNPVNWYPWGEKALSKAKNENKPVIISIGYNSCHWCHVMERESYSDSLVADIMNSNFISVKVDREERPDVDQVYMSAAILISGQGGWPLNVFALPDSRPFYSVTYCPKNEWIELLKQVGTIFRTRNAELVTQAENITNGINIQDNALINVPELSTFKFELTDYKNIINNWKRFIDFESGGFSGAPKFPLPVGWEALLQYFYFTKDIKALEAVTVTLDKMAMGGIYDHVGGGFARYSTDKFWKVPHFEKMLYDNAQLISLYAHTYQLTKNSNYKDVMIETLDFIKEEMTNPDGGFYSSINADSEGVEGKFYSWTKKEFDDVPDIKDSGFLSAYFNIQQTGNWENNQNILYVNENKEAFANKNGFSPEGFKQLYNVSRNMLLESRNKRIRPTTDFKILTSWNALMMIGYIDAYRTLGNLAYLNAAIKNATFVELNMIGKDNSLYRNYVDGNITIQAFLDDYALLAEAFIELYKVTFNIHWLINAKGITDYSIQHFYGTTGKMFFYTSDKSESLFARKMEIQDNVIPSSNSVTAKNLYFLGAYFDSPKYTEMSVDMLTRIKDNIARGGPYFANWAFLLGFLVNKPLEIAIIGENAISINLKIQQNYLPEAIIAGGNEENLPLLEKKKVNGKTKIYICQNKTCLLSCEDVEEAINFLNLKI